MTDRLVLHGYNASRYVFSVRILLAGKALTYESVPLDVLAGEPASEAHRVLHPFGKVPVLTRDDRRIIDTGAIMRHPRFVRYSAPGVARIAFRGGKSRFMVVPLQEKVQGTIWIVCCGRGAMPRSCPGQGRTGSFWSIRERA